MDLALSREQRAFREEVRDFLASSLSPALRRGAALTSGVFAEPDIARQWQAILEAKGWLVYHWQAGQDGRLSSAGFSKRNVRRRALRSCPAWD